MTSTLAALALSGLLASGGPAYVGGTGAALPGLPVQDTLAGPGGAVPYVAQGPLLCGGAAAAMVRRYWGELGVYAEDYEALVSSDEGGIRTGELAAALEHQGYAARVLRDDPAAVLAHVRAGAPVVALLESGAARYHYVVIVAAGPERIRYHDPLKGPDRVDDREDFLRQWSPTGYWALVGTPAPAAADPASPAPTDAPTAEGREAGSDTASLPASLREGLDLLRAGRPDSAARAVTRHLSARDDLAHRDLAWQMLGSARYLAGDRMEALAAWNRIGEPPVDLVHVRGIRSVRHSTVVDATGITPQTVLTPEDLRLARRRVRQLPAVGRARVEYSPLRDGSVAVNAFITERRPAPFSAVEVTALGLGALVNREAELELGPLLPVGERWRLQGSWRPARSLAAGAVAVPWSPAASVVTLRAGWTEERYGEGAGDRSRTWGTATAERWLAAETRAGVTLGVERWDGGSRLGRLGFSLLRTFADDRVRIATAVDGWAGAPGRFARVRTAARARVPSGPRAWTVTVGGSVSSEGAPPTIWDGAGTGQIRAPLLRGHPLVRDDRVRGAALGRGLAHATLAWGWHLQAGPASASLELFVDGARVWDPLLGDGPRDYVDPGVELGLSSGTGTVALSLARGDDWVVSARFDAPVLPWLAVP